ncbi:GM13443 [Drosophila sechellia]|uniref:GM13443 n=1 Tax=Drosophila sechellia TaxID=7238 RepID=B4IF89_DROSE|nr:GM13443 [Drosophila sechellia]
MRLEEFDGSLHYLTVDEADCANAAADKMAARVEETIPTCQIRSSGELRSVT